MLRISGQLLGGGPGRSLCRPTAHGVSDGPFRRLKFKVDKSKSHRKYRDVLVSGDVDTLLSTARELLLNQGRFRVSMSSSGGPQAGEAPGAPEKSEGFWSVFGRRAKESLRLMKLTDAAFIAAAFEAHKRDTGIFVALASAFADFAAARERKGSQRRQQQQQQRQQEVLLQREAAAAATAATPAAAAVAEAAAAAAGGMRMSEGKGLLVLMSILSSNLRAPLSAYPQVYRHLNMRLPRLFHQLTGSEVVRILEAATQQQQQPQQQGQQVELLGQLVYRKVAASTSSFGPTDLCRAVLSFNACGLRPLKFFEEVELRSLELRQQFQAAEVMKLLRGFAAAAIDTQKLLEGFEPMLAANVNRLTRSEASLLAQLVQEADTQTLQNLRSALSNT
ncbi:hypothetical protein Esti_002136 [Eimeria stiedai]